jgi:hypothetical protein
MLSKKKDYIFCFLFGAYIAAVLWITLFSRIGEGYRGFLLPFYSYVEILKGEWRPLLENIGNVILFIPLGVVLGVVKKWDVKRAGFFTSLFIEVLQLTFALGTFECDDLIHNTFGAVIGAWCVGKIGGEIRLGSQMRKVILLSMVLCSAIPVGYKEVRHQKMVRLAAIYDREDGTKNLLVLNGKNGYAWDTDVYVKHLNDGSINISGTSDKRSWWPIADITLESGHYSASGLEDTTGGLLGIELAYYNKYSKKYEVLCPDIGMNPTVEFELSETTPIRAYVRVYPGFHAECTATPVIYKEEKG